MARLQITFLLFMIFISANAHKREFIGGLLYNHNISLFFGSDSRFLNSKNYLAISAGIFVKKEFNDRLYATFELRYSQKGNGYNKKNNSDVGVRLNYIDLPVLLGYNFVISKRKYSLEIGFAYGILINSKIRYNDFSNMREEIDDFKNKDYNIVLSSKTFINKKENLLLGLRVGSADHIYYEVHRTLFISNIIYGIEINYLIF